MRRDKLKIVLAGWVLLAATAVCWAAPTAVGTFRLPVAETEEVVADWLEQRGFAVTSDVPEAGMAGLRATVNGKAIHVVIRPDSPLVSLVEIDEGIADRATVDGLQSCLDQYVRSLDEGQDVGMNPQVPDKVIAQAGTVLCLKSSAHDESVQFSGFVIDRHGLIVTTAHDLDDAAIRVAGRGGAGLRGEIVRRDRARDLSLIRIDRLFRRAASVEDGLRQVKEGDRVYVIGCPKDGGVRIVSGVVNRPPAMVAGQPLWQVEMEIAPGTSGAPAFDGEGRLVGVVKGHYRGTERRGFLIPLDTVREFLRGER